jgi:50S ribosomal subunit-associated GTPase HflX
MDIPVFKGRKNVDFIDTTGISSSINFNQDVREGMVQTLMLLFENYLILHIIDAADIAYSKKIDEIDRDLYMFGTRRGNYLLLANKYDLQVFNEGFKIIKENMSETKIIKISALDKAGFNEVKRYVSRLA